MKKNERILSIFLACILCVGVLSACGSGSADTSVTEPDVTRPDDTTAEDVPDPLLLVDDGKTDYVIVRGENAYITEVTASTELQSYLKLITGVEIPIVTDSTAPAEKEIVVGKTNRETEGAFDREELGDDGLVIRTDGKKLFLVGGEKRGTLHAVYEFLESYLGCRFYTKDLEKVPEMRTVSVSVEEEDKQIPVYTFRATSSRESLGADSCAKRKLNGIFNLAKEYGSDQMWIESIHSYTTLIPPEAYYKEHPEYFSKTLTEEDISNETDFLVGQPCLTNPEVLEIVINNTRELLSKYKDDPRYTVMPIAQNDNPDYCKCDNCTALYNAEESYAAATLQFVNSVATALGDEFPHITFVTLAYQYSRNVPKTIRPAENVAIILCTIEECFSHPRGTHEESVNSSGAYINNTFKKDFEDWAAITDNLYIWDYTLDYSHTNCPYPNFDVLLANEKFFADKNIIGVFEENIVATLSSFNQLRSYLISKLLWDPYMTEEEYQALIDDFLEFVYGKGWTYIREYIDLIHKESDKNCFGTFASVFEIYDFEEVDEVHKVFECPEELTFEMIQNYETTDWTPYWNFFKDLEAPEAVTKGYELFDKAYEAAETDSQRAAVERALVQVLYLDSEYRLKRIDTGNNSFGWIIDNFFRKNSNGLSAAERTALKKSITELAREQMLDEFEEFNKGLFELYEKYGLTRKTEEPDLRESPFNW